MTDSDVAAEPGSKGTNSTGTGGYELASEEGYRCEGPALDPSRGRLGSELRSKDLSTSLDREFLLVCASVLVW